MTRNDYIVLYPLDSLGLLKDIDRDVMAVWSTFGAGVRQLAAYDFISQILEATGQVSLYYCYWLEDWEMHNLGFSGSSVLLAKVDIILRLF